jgi:hypothetical protein
MTLVVLYGTNVFSLQVEHFFTYPFVVKYVFGLETTSRVEKALLLLRGKKYYHTRKNVRGVTHLPS